MPLITATNIKKEIIMADQSKGTTKAPKSKKQLAAEAREREQALLTRREAELIAQHGTKIVEGSIRRGRTGSKHENKLTVEINTVGEDGQPDGKTLRVATSDVHQVTHQPEVADRLRRARRNERARQARAEARAERLATVE